MPNDPLSELFSDVNMRGAIEAARDLAGLGSWGWDERAQTKFWSPRTRAIFGLAEDAQVNRDVFLRLLHPDDVPAYERAWTAAIDPRGDRCYHLVYRIRRGGDGAERWISSRAMVEFEGEAPIRVVGAVRDITDEKANADNLRTSELRFEVALRNSHVVVSEQDLDLRYTWVFNPKLGFAIEDIVGKTDRELMQPACADELEAIKRKVIATGRPVRAEVTAAAVGAPLEWFDLYVEARRDDAGAIIGVICAATEITGRRLASEQIQLLLHEVNHRAKNLLTLVQGIARQTLRRHPDDFMEAFGARLQALAANQDVLVRHEWKNVEIGALVRSQLRPFEDTLGARFAMQGPELRVSAQAAQTLGMALHELGTNAAKHGSLTRAEGVVQLDWRVTEGSGGARIFVMSWVERGGPLVVAPARDGFGTSVLGDITRASLGATVALDFAERGFSWRLECPLDNVGGVEWRSAVGSAPAAEGGERGRILVVEDEPLVALELTQCLREAGFSVLGPSRSAAQALELLGEFGCDAAVLDINLGEETSESVAQELLRLGKPFVTLSGYARDQRPVIFAEVPAFNKPVRPHLLIAELGRRIGADAVP
jgi:PAS domain S-box-containing protein